MVSKTRILELLDAENKQDLMSELNMPNDHAEWAIGMFQGYKQNPTNVVAIFRVDPRCDDWTVINFGLKLAESLQNAFLDND